MVMMQLRQDDDPEADWTIPGVYDVGAGVRDYLDSLKLVRGLPDRRLLPAHGPVAPSVHARVDELVEHHDTRLRLIDETIGAGAHTASEAARRMLWTRRGRAFTELDLLGRCLAVTETMAHLDVLVHAGRLSRTEVDGIASYTRGVRPPPAPTLSGGTRGRAERAGLLFTLLGEFVLTGDGPPGHRR